MSVNTIKKEELKSLLIELFEEDSAFLKKMTAFFSGKSIALQETPSPVPNQSHDEFMHHIRDKYALKKEVVEDLQELWKDELPAEELTKMLSK